MADNEVTNRVIFETDESAKAKLIEAYKQIQQAQKDTAKVSNTAGTSYKAVAKETRELAKQQGDVLTVMRALDKEWANQVTAANEATDSAEDYKKSIAGIKAPSMGGIQGGIGSNLSDVRGALSTLGGEATRPALELAGGIGDAVEAIGSLGGSMTSLLTVALPLAVAIGFLSLAMGEYNRVAEEQRKQLSAVIEAQRSTNQAVAEGLTTEDAQARIEELTSKRAAEAETLATLNTAYGNLETGLKGIDGGLGLVNAAVKQFDSREEELVSQLNTSQAAVAGYDAEIAALTEKLNSGELSANDTVQAEEELAAIREQESQQAILQAEQASARIGQLLNQQTNLLQNRAIAEQNASELEAFDKRIANEDEIAETKAHLDDLAAIQQAGQARVADIFSQIQALGLEQAKAIVDIETKGSSELAKNQAEYFKNSIKANEDYQRDLERSNTEFAKSQKRLAEDINKSLNDAYRENDVIAFLKAQEEGNTQLKRNAEDAKDSEKQKAEDFARSQEEQRAAFQERQAAILLGIEEEKQKVLQAAIEKRAALQAQIEQEKLATQQAIANANTRYQQSEALEDQQLKRQQERQAIVTSQQDAAFQRQIANIQTELSAQNNLYATISAGISRVTAQAAALGSVKPSYNSANIQGSGSFGSGGVGGGIFTNSGGNTTNINMNVGDIATGQQVTNAIQNAVNGVLGVMGNVFQGSS